MGRSVELTRPGRHNVAYDVDVVLISPVAAKILDDQSGTVEGRARCGNYFERGLELYPNLHFDSWM